MTRAPARSARWWIGAALVLGVVAIAERGSAQEVPTPTTSTLDGSSPGNAAASCWEIGQRHPDTVDGIYWLRTESLVRPRRFRCDMTIDGGGWVLIGRDGAPVLDDTTIDDLLDHVDEVEIGLGGADDGWQQRRAEVDPDTGWSWSEIDGVTGGSLSELYLRPRLTTPALDAIPDAGVGERTSAPQLAEHPDELAGGVRSTGGGGPDPAVLAITTTQERVVVGGAFDHVRDVGTGELTPHAYLAAFDRRSGAWIPSFAPELNGAVRALAVVDGRLLVRGDFTTVGTVATSGGLVALDPMSGEVLDTSPSMPATESTGSEDPLGHRTLELGPDSGPHVVTWHTDVDGCVWFGGDVVGGPRTDGRRHYLEGFSRFCVQDLLAPATPGEAIASIVDGAGVRLAWSESVDDRGAAVGYEVLRNDRVVSPLLDSTGWHDPDGRAHDRYFVRAVDEAGNRSASTAVLLPGDHRPPSTPMRLAAVVDGRAVELSWEPSVDETGVERYLVVRNGVELGEFPGNETTVRLDDLGPGSHWLQVSSVDGAGNESPRTSPVRIDIERELDVQRPTQPGAPSAAPAVDGNVVVVSWAPSVDDVGVAGYRVRRNLDEVAVTDARSLSATLDLGTGEHFVQVEAFDDAGNVSYRTAPIRVVVEGAGSGRAPSAPVAVTARQVSDDSVAVAWRPGDGAAVAAYEVLHNGEVVLVVEGSRTDVVLSGLEPGAHWIQLAALDDVDRRSVRTAPTAVRLDPIAVDLAPPAAPGDPVVVVGPDGTIAVSWSASTDDVGVEWYRVLRNLAEVARVDGAVLATTLDLDAGEHWIQIQAVDAAGNESRRTPPVLVTT